MPKENFDKIDRRVALARENPALRRDVIRGLRSAFKTFEGARKLMERELEKFKGHPPLEGFEAIWIETRERLRAEQRRAATIVEQTRKRLQAIRTAKKSIDK